MKRDPQRICTANKSDGTHCKAYAIKGGTVCRVHGGSAPQVKAAAMKRLLDAVDPVAGELVKMAMGDKRDSVKLAAAKDVLDRAGIGEPARSEVTILTDDVLVAEIARLKAELGDA